MNTRNENVLSPDHLLLRRAEEEIARRPGYIFAPFRGALVLVVAVLLAGCRGGAGNSTTSGPAAPKTIAFKAPGTESWKLTWTDPKTASPAVLFNASMGIRIGPAGNAFDQDGNHLPMFWDSDYDAHGQERLLPTPSPFTVAIGVNGSLLDPMKSTDWQQTLDMSNGQIETSWTDQSHGSPIRVITTSVIDPKECKVGQQWIVTPSSDAKIQVNLDFRDLGPDQVKVSRPVVTWGSDDKEAEIHYASNLEPEAFSRADLSSPKPIEIAIPGGRSLIFSSSLRLKESDNTYAIGTAMDPTFGNGHIKFLESDPNASYQHIVQASTRARGGEDQPDIEIEGPIEDQQAVRSFIYYLQSGIGQNMVGTVSPFGMSSELYGGHVFWDADIWAFPALAFIDSAAAQAIPQYRIKHEKDAVKNYASWQKTGGPTGDPKYRRLEDTLTGGTIPLRLKYPWESSVSGLETTTGSSRFEDHITGSVAYELKQAASLGLADENRTREIVGLASNFYRVRSDDTKGPLMVKGVMSPDENHVGDNDLYTNLLAFWCMNGGKFERPAWEDDNPVHIYLPRDSTSFLTYDNDPLKSYKQAAAILAIYPLQYPPAEAQAKVMMDRFASKVSPNGPAMSDSINAIIWARIGEPEQAYDAWRHGWMDFVRPPFLLFSEKRNLDRTYFLTGAAGELQSVIYGFLGFRIDSKPEAGASWSLKLKGDRWLSIKPNLPKAWNRVTFRNFHVLGKTYTLTATHQSVQVTQGD